MKQILGINDPLWPFNNYQNINRRDKFEANRIKKVLTLLVKQQCKEQKLVPFDKPIHILYRWQVKSYAWDPDNIAFSKKFINDGLEAAGIVKKDNLRWIKSLHDFYIVDKNSIAGVIIEMYTDYSEDLIKYSSIIPQGYISGDGRS